MLQFLDLWLQLCIDVIYATMEALLEALIPIYYKINNVENKQIEDTRKSGNWMLANPNVQEQQLFFIACHFNIILLFRAENSLTYTLSSALNFKQ